MFSQVASPVVTNEGAIVWWTPGHFTDPAIVKTHLQPLGLETYAPNVRTVERALYYALDNIFARSHAGTKREVRPIKGRGFEVVEFRPGDSQVELTHLFSVWIDKVANTGKVMAHSTTGQSIYDMNKPEFTAVFRRAFVTAGQDTVTQSLVAILTRLNGIRLRPNGSVYWLHADQLPLWEQINQGFAMASNLEHVHRTIRHEINPESAMAVLDGLRTQVRDQANELQREIDAGTLGGRALESRVSQLKDLHKTVTYYEDKFSVGLSDLTAVLDTVSDAAVYAIQQVALAKAKNKGES